MYYSPLIKWDEAAALLRKKIAVHSASSEIHLAYGNCLFGCGKVSEAIDIFYKTIELSPNSISAREGLSKSLIQRHKFHDAISVLLTSIRLDPGNPKHSPI